MTDDWDEKTGRMSTPHHPVPPEDDVVSLGNLITRYCPVTSKQIAEAVAYQRAHPGPKLGEVLISMGLATEDSVRRACEDQKALRRPRSSIRKTSIIMDELAKAERKASILDDALDAYTQMVHAIVAKLKRK
jgi:hypothetical protein